MSYKLVEDLQKKACPKVAISQACRVLEVSRAGYYANVAVRKKRIAAPALYAASVHLKAAFAASHKAYGTNDIADYIVGFYNSIRLHSKLGNLSPNAFERESTSKKSIELSEIT